MRINNFFNINEIDKIINFMKKDKKNSNEKLNLILMDKIGKTSKPHAHKINVNEMKKFLSSFYKK